MFSTLSAIAKVTNQIDGANITPDLGHLLAIPSRRSNIYGILFPENMLLMDYGKTMSFRVQYGNLGTHRKVQIYLVKRNFDIRMLADYFASNRDNPYALMYVMGRIAIRNDVEIPLTQVPPVAPSYQSLADRMHAIDSLIALVEPSDLVFSRSLQSSPVSGLIRRFDKGQFSHVGSYVGNGMTLDAGPSGVARNSIHDLMERCHVAIYRFREPLTEEQRRRMLSWLESQVGCGYNWLGVIDLFLRQTLRIKTKTASVSALLFSDTFRLIGYV